MEAANLARRLAAEERMPASRAANDAATASLRAFSWPSVLIKPCYLLLEINLNVLMIGHLFDLVRDMFR
jgi:hypothetical protein